MSRQVGSPSTAIAGARPLAARCASTRSVPMLLVSSPSTSASPSRNGSDARALRATAQHIAATDALASFAPRP
jgi:hypothetical protein